MRVEQLEVAFLADIAPNRQLLYLPAMNVAIFLPNWVGDLVMATPALRAVRRYLGPAARITGILRPQLAELLAGSPWIDELHAFDPRSPRREHGRLALISKLRRERLDTALLLTNSLHTAAMAWLSGARQRVGFARDGRSWLLTHRVQSLRDGRRYRPAPMVESYLALARAIGCPVESPRLELSVTPHEAEQAARVWRDLGFNTNGRVVALNSTGAYGAAKLWPAEHCAALARGIVDELDHDVVVLCGPGERDAARQIAARSGSPRVHSLAAQEASLGLTKGCLARCRLMVSTDSGPRHIAAALGLPVVTLLGPTRSEWIANPTVRGPMLRAELPCLGCGQRECPLGHHRCMKNLSPGRVLREVAALLHTSTTKAA
jgi:heptosyltransferase-2